MALRNTDQGFDEFRRQRMRKQAKLGTSTAGVLGFENQALRELEQVEAREVLDQKLTREVHEFFMSATKQAATIVEKVSRDAQQEAGARVEQEMEAFLMDALSRMNSLVIAMVHQKRGPVAETQVEPKVANLVGQMLDKFRFDGTADVLDKHIGQDPFATDVDEVQREFREQISDMAPPPAAGAAPIEDHLVAAMQGDEDADDEPAPAPAVARRAAPRAPAPAPAAAEHDGDEDAQGEAGAQPRAPTPAEELERFKSALKALVRQGTMTRDEARAAWQTRLKAMGVA